MQRTHCEKSTNTPRNTHETPREWVAFTHEIGCEHSVRRRGPIHRARILILPKMCIHFTEYVCPFQHIRISTLLNMCIHSSHAHFRSSFCGCLRICGHDKSVPTVADGLQQRCERFTNYVTPTHEIGCEHSVRRRGPIHRTRILILPKMCVHFKIYVFSHY